MTLTLLIDMKLPSREDFLFEKMYLGLAKTTVTGKIVFNGEFYKEINFANADLFLGSMAHELKHYNRTDFWDKVFDKIPAKWNEGHQILDDQAQKMGDSLYKDFQERTGCCYF